jgi:hypothetical protein
VQEALLAVVEVVLAAEHKAVMEFLYGVVQAQADVIQRFIPVHGVVQIIAVVMAVLDKI